MGQVNENLKKYHVWDALLDSVMVITVPDSSIVFDWREQAEKPRREAGYGAMSKEEVMAFCDRYMPSYETYMDSIKLKVPEER